jgi:hypothetical protein
LYVRIVNMMTEQTFEIMAENFTCTRIIFVNIICVTMSLCYTVLIS